MSIPAVKQIEKILNSKGQFVSVHFRSDVKASAANKNVKLHKETKAVVKAGINFANLKRVKNAIENGERSEIGELPWGNWFKFPYIIEHKLNFYLRLYPSINNIPKVSYFVDGKEVDKLNFASFLTPSAQKGLLEKSEPSECFTLKATNILDITE